MKKILSCMFLLIFTLGIGTTCFGAKSWSQSDFEKLIECMGYGELDLNSMTFTGSFSSLSSFLGKLSSSSTGLLIYKGNNSSGDGFDDSKFTVLFPSTNPKMELNSDEYYIYTDRYSSFSFTPAWQFNLKTKTVYYTNSSDVSIYNPYIFKKEFNKVAEEEWNSEAYRRFLFESACIYSDVSILNTGYVPQGGKILTSSNADVLYTGSISYSPTTKKASITYTSGFSADTYYDIFLERYRLDNESSSGSGISAYPTETIDLGDITTSDTTFSINMDNWALSSMNVYRLCVGINKDGTGTSNTVLLATDWLIPNCNTLRRYPVFARSHYFQFLDLVAYNPDYSDPIDTPDINTPSGDDLINEKDIYIYSGNCLGGFINSTDIVNVNVKRKNTSIDIEDYFFILDSYDYFTNELIESTIIQNDNSINQILWNSPIDEDGLVFFVVLSDYYNFNLSNDYYYKLRLHSFTKGYVDSTSSFYFNNTFFVETDEEDTDREEIKKGISGILESIVELPLKIITGLIDGLKSLFIPSEGFFETYWNDINTFFNEKLGFLWDAVMFIPTLGETIITLVEGFTEELVFKIPEISVPDFIGGEVVLLQPFEWKPREFINSDETIASLYDLYLNLIDFFVAFGLVNYALSVISDLFKIKQGVPDKEPIGFKPED